MTFKRLNKLIEDNEETYKVISAIENTVVERPYIVEETLKILSDGSVLYDTISDKNKIALCNMMRSYYNTCYMGFLTGDSYENAVKYGKRIIYHVETKDGIREATVNEISSGVEQLIGEEVYSFGKENYRTMCLIMWSYTGHVYYYKEAGYNVTYDSSGIVNENIFDMIKKSAEHINEMMQWYKTEQFSKAIKIADKVRKQGDYKYANYDEYEIVEEISVKQLLNNVTKQFPRKSESADYRRALGLALRSKERKLSPMEISFIRKQYNQFVRERREGASSGRDDKTDERLVEICGELLEVRYKGIISSEEFGYKIISTLRSKNYASCSEKQRRCILELYDKYLKAAGKDGAEEDCNELRDVEINRETVNMYSSISDILDEE